MLMRFRTWLRVLALKRTVLTSSSRALILYEVLAPRRALLNSSSTVLILYVVLVLITAVLNLVREATCTVHLIKVV